MNHSSNKYLLNTYHVQGPVLVFLGNTKTWMEQKEEANRSYKAAETGRVAGVLTSEASKDGEMDDVNMSWSKCKDSLRGLRKAGWHQGPGIKSNGINIQATPHSDPSRGQGRQFNTIQKPWTTKRFQESSFTPVFMLPVDHIKPLCRPWGLRMPPEDVGAFRCLLIHALYICKGFPGICHASHRNEVPLRVTHNYGYRLCSGTLPQAQALKPGPSRLC